MRLTITVLVVLMLVAAGCAGPGVLDGTDVSEQSADNGAAEETPPPAASDEPRSPGEPDVESNESHPNDAILEHGAPGQEESDGTAPALVTSTTVQKSIPTPPANPPTPAETVPPTVAESDFVGKAKEDLAERLGIAADSIAVVSVQEVDWPDSSIGCPQPDMVYAQVISNGSRIILSHNSVSYSYHSAGAKDPFYCENPIAPVPGSET